MLKHPPVHSLHPESGVGQASIWPPVGPTPKNLHSTVGCASSQHPHIGTRGNHPPESGNQEELIAPEDGVDGLGSWQSANSGRFGALAWS